MITHLTSRIDQTRHHDRAQPGSVSAVRPPADHRTHWPHLGSGLQGVHLGSRVRAFLIGRIGSFRYASLRSCFETVRLIPWHACTWGVRVEYFSHGVRRMKKIRFAANCWKQKSAIARPFCRLLRRILKRLRQCNRGKPCWFSGATANVRGYIR